MAATVVAMITHNTCLLEYKLVTLLPNSTLFLQLSTIAVQLFFNQQKVLPAKYLKMPGIIFF